MKKDLGKYKTLWMVGLVLLLVGCGLKANPVPLVSADLPMPVADKLAAKAKENAIVLTWMLNDPAGRVRYIDIARSRLGSPGNVCKDCPGTFEKIGQFRVDDPKKSEYRFTDFLAEKGQTYRYRLNLCDDADFCNESQTVEENMK